MFYIAVLAILIVLIVVVATIIDNAWTNITRRQNEFHWHVIQSPDGDFVTFLGGLAQLVADISNRVFGEEWLPILEFDS